MSRFLSESASSLTPYTPGEQPQDKGCIKLNTNECPYAPSLLVLQAVERFQAGELRLYPDPTASRLRDAAAEAYGLPADYIFAGGGSDEILAFAFMAFFEKGDPVLFPDVTYGFYKVYADLFGLSSIQIPLAEDFSVNLSDYTSAQGHFFLANPNAPTGIPLSPGQIEEFLRENPGRLLILDEAYVDFDPGCSCVQLTKRYDNLLVVQTFSKSRALAGMRIGFAFGNPELIAALERIKYSFNPYNLVRVTIEVGIAALKDTDYTKNIAARIIRTRQETAAALAGLGFESLPSGANFLFSRIKGKDGGWLYQSLKDKGILVRHFGAPRISDFIRISVGSEKEMKALVGTLEEIL